MAMVTERGGAKRLWAVVAATVLSVLLVMTPQLAWAASGEKEPNNNPFQPNKISLGTEVTGALASAEDEDWFRLEVAQPMTVKLSVKIPAATKGRWEFLVYGAVPDDGYLGMLELDATEKNESSVRVRLEKGVNYVAVWPESLENYNVAGYSFVLKESPTTWKRLAGKGRYDTIAAIVKEGWSSVKHETAIVATGASFKDALAAAGLAGVYGEAPVVLTDSKVLSGQAKARLQALQPQWVYVVGGPLAVSDDVLQQIGEATGVKPTRIMGQTSAGTSAALALQEKGAWTDGIAIIATNKSFKDALSVAPVSYVKRWPILLADNGQSLSADVLKALKECKIKKVFIVGGELAVTKNVENQLKAQGIAIADRLAGATAVKTSREIAWWALDLGLGVDKMAFATSQNFPDALAGAALCGKNKGVLLLADDKAPGNLTFAEGNASDITKGYVFGGNLAFSDELFAKLP